MNTGNAERAQDTTRNVCMGGVGLLILGCIIAALARPHDVIKAGGAFERSHVVHKGSHLLAYLGLGVAGIGEMLILVALIAWGVRLGIMSVERRESSSDEARQARGYVGGPTQPWTNPLAKRDEDDSAG